MPSLAPLGGTLGRKNAAHLLRRATFGATKSDIDQFANKTAAQAIADLLAEQPLPAPPTDPDNGQPWIDPAAGRYVMGEDYEGDLDLKEYIRAWWMAQMGSNPLSAHDKIVYFFHTHFTTMISRIRETTAIYYQLALFRGFTTGNFKTLTRQICIDNAMLRFLDGRLNTRSLPQENFARELLELYSIGKGQSRGEDDYTTFTEQDVREGARVLSGWDEDRDFQTIDPITGLASGRLKGNGDVANQHDEGAKVFSDAFQGEIIQPNALIGNRATKAAAEAELDQMMDMIFRQEETARHICRKLYRFFVYYHITDEIEQDIIDPLAATLRNNNYELLPALTQLLSSTHFYDTDNAQTTDDNIGAIIKSPLELVMGTLRFFRIGLPDPVTQPLDLLGGYYNHILNILEDQGMELYEPFEVAGYAAYHQAPAFNRNWVSSNYLAQRYKFAETFLYGNGNEENPVRFTLDVMAYVNDPQNITDPSDPELLVREFVEYLLPEALDQERFDYFLNAILLDNLSVLNWQMEWQNYQNTGDDTAVKRQLESLVYTLLNAPEYQLQ